jgi:hypothetical protein
MVEDLTQRFHSLSEEEQRAFLARIMPSVCRLFRKDPQAMMDEMMPLCRETMSSCAGGMNEMGEMMCSTMKR